MARFGAGPSREGQQLASDIRNGKTPYAQERARMDNLIKTAAIAGLQGVSALSKHVESKSLQEKTAAKTKNEATQAAIRNAKRPPNHPDDTPRDEYGLEVERPGYAGAMDNAVRQGQFNNYNSEPRDIPQLAKTTLAQGDANEAASRAPIGGRWTEKGFEEADAEAELSASDIQMARNLMEQAKMNQGASQFGGLGNSFARGY